MDELAVVIVIAFSAAFLGLLVVAARRPDLVERLYQESLWARVIAWIVVLGLAALLGAALAGPTEAFVSAIVVVSGILLYVAYEFWIGAAWRRWRDR